MKNVRPACHGTVIREGYQEWLPRSFEEFLQELGHLESQFNTEDRLLGFEGIEKENGS